MIERKWRNLWEIAQTQGGYFWVKQALDLDITRQSICYERRHGDIERVFHGVYRFTWERVDEDDTYLFLYAWSKGEAIISHGSALSFYNLSDIFPSRAEIIFQGRNRHPDVLYKAYPYTLSQEDWLWHGGFKVTTAARAVRDYARINGQPDILFDAIDQGIRRGLFSIQDVGGAVPIEFCHQL